jgi:serine/threonine protein kinase/Tfp pilus assembly protein PilF
MAEQDTGILPPGFKLERYRIVKHLAAGGFGITYLAEHSGLAKQYAIKEHFPREFASRDGTSVRPNTADTNIYQWALLRFAEEAKKLAKFKHPAIVNVADVFEANGTAYMVMEFEPGTTMTRWLEALGRPPTQVELDRIAAPLLDALELMHRENFLHRDIAPDNIMIRPDGSPCLIDFGAARQSVGQQSKTLTAIIKAGYSPAEQYDTEGTQRQGPWSDIYALAATFYRAVCGARPPESPGRLLEDNMKLAVQRAASGYRREFLEAIDAALAVVPKSRPQSVAEWRPKLFAGAPQGGAGVSTPIFAPPPTLLPPGLTPVTGVDPASRPASERPPVTPLVPPAVHALHSGPVPPVAPLSPVATRRRSPWPMRLGIGGGLIAAALAGAFMLLRPSNDEMADAEFAKIRFSTEIKPFEDLQKRYPSTSAAKKAEARVADLKRLARHAAAANEWSRLRDSNDERAIERFIEDHADAPVVADAKSRLAEVKRRKAADEKLKLAAEEWSRIRSTGDIAAIQKFLQTHGDSSLAAEARTRLAELQGKARLAEAEAEWNRIKSTESEASLESFINRHGESPHANEARTKLAALRQGKAREERARLAAIEWARIVASEDEAVILRFLRDYGDSPSARFASLRLEELRRKKAAGERERLAAEEWGRIKLGGDIAALQRFLQIYGDTQLAADARVRLAELQRREKLAEAEAEWNRIRFTDVEASLESFINRHGESPHANEARTKLAALRQAKAREERAAQEWARIRSTSDIVAINVFLSNYGDTKIAAEARQRKATLEQASSRPNEADLADCRQGADHDRRIRGCTALINARSNLAEAYHNRAIAHYAKKNDLQALADIEEAIKINPRDPIYYANRGVARVSLRQYDLALKDFDQAIQLNPSYAFAFYQRGRAHNDQKNWDRAIDDLGQAIKLRPDSKSYEERAYAHLSKNDLVAALSDYSEAIKLDPLSHIAFNGRGVVYERQGRRSEALEAYRKALAINSKFEVARNNIARLEAQKANTSTNIETKPNPPKKKDDSKHTGTDQSVKVPPSTNTNTNKRGPSTGTN